MTAAQPSAAPAARPDALPALTGLRFVAALSVMVGHIMSSAVGFGGPDPLWHHYLSQLSGIGMPLFFVLSGFVIHYNYHEAIRAAPRRGTWNFLVFRFARLYPMYIAVLLFDLFQNNYWQNWAQPDVYAKLHAGIPSYLILVQSWYYRMLGEQSVVFAFTATLAVTWSISTEWFFYLVYPLISAAIARLRRLRAIAAAIGIIVAAGYAAVLGSARILPAVNAFGIAHYGPAAGPLHPISEFAEWVFYLAPYTHLFEFGLGCLTAALYAALRHTPVAAAERRAGSWALAAALLGIASMFLAIYTPGFWRSPVAWVLGMYFGFAPFIALLLFCCTRYATPVSAALSARWMVICGEASYSIYLLHAGIVQYVQAANAAAGVSEPAYTGWSVAHALATAAVIAIAVIGIALITYHVIEVPARRWLRSRLTLPARAAAARAAADLQPP